MTISERIFKANAAVECEKLMSRHVYLHAAAIHRQEIDQYWSKSDDISWTHNFGQIGNRKDFYTFYADSQEENNTEIFNKLAKIYPEVLDKNNVPDYRAMHEMSLHFTVSPIIEVAEDGKTAKGLFYTPGFIYSVLNPQRTKKGTWIWERYGADFVYEDGKWVYRNLKICCDINGPMDAPDWPIMECQPIPSGTDENEGKPPPAPKGITFSGPMHYDLTPTQLPQERPFIPVPHRTFSETYNYKNLTGKYEKY